MAHLNVLPHIARLKAYAPPWTGLDRREFVRFDLNECTEPLPKVSVDAITGTLKYVPLYPEYRAFNEKLAAYTGTSSDCVMITNGSDQGIDVILRAFLAPGDSMAIARPEFPMFGQTIGILGAQVTGTPYQSDLQFPYQAFRESITSDTKLITVINPNNPTGTLVELAYIEQLLRDFPTTPVLVDEAYFEFTGCTILPLLDQYSNLIVLRTFSKAFAMAGLRIGYVVAQPDVIGELLKVRGPFDVNSAAVAAAAAQLDAPEESQSRVNEIMQKSKPMLEDYFASAGVKFHSGAANFLLIEPEDRDAAVAFLKADGILVRPMYPELIRSMFRMSLGTPSEVERFIGSYDRFLASASATL